MLNLLDKIAKTDKNVLILGETGTGKDLAARRIHERSDRGAFPFLTVNCANLSPELLESELYGHVRGAFTGAISDKKGLIEIAENGTLFFDEIGELSHGQQAKILRIIEDRMVRRLGDKTARRINTRFLFATNNNLKERAFSGVFRKDLYFRISALTIYLPPLKERKSDIPDLVNYFLDKECQSGLPRKTLTKKALNKLLNHDFPGNIRELKNIIERACFVSDGTILEEEDIYIECDQSFPALVETRHNLRKTLENCHWNKTAAASRMGLSRRHFYRVLERHQLGDLIKRRCCL